MKIGDQKVQRTLRKQKVRGLLQDKKGPWDQTGVATVENSMEFPQKTKNGTAF